MKFNRWTIALSLITDAILISLAAIAAWGLEKVIEYFLVKSSLDNTTISSLQLISSITTLISFVIFAIVDILKLLIKAWIEIKDAFRKNQFDTLTPEISKQTVNKKGVRR